MNRQKILLVNVMLMIVAGIVTALLGFPFGLGFVFGITTVIFYNWLVNRA